MRCIRKGDVKITIRAFQFGEEQDREFKEKVKRATAFLKTFDYIEEQGVVLLRYLKNWKRN